MPTTRSQAVAAPCAGRKRKATEAIATTAMPKRAKLGQSADATYLQQAVEEFRKQHDNYPKRSQRRRTLEMVQRYFRGCQMPSKQDAHFVDDKEAARRIMASNDSITLPVFVRDGAHWSMIDRTDERRPIKQLFDFMHDPSEEEEYNDEASPEAKNRKMMSIREIKKTFLSLNRPSVPRFPRNFPDLVNPMLDRGIPQFVQNASCAVLHDIIRRQLDCGLDELCTCSDEDAETEHCGHRIKLSEFVALQQASRYWPGTVMLAEAGCVTHPHWDKYSTGTWISCLEGEIGFAWLSNPTKKEETGWLEDVEKPKGRWLFKVLRPGDAAYMPPGIVHLVFRRPGGGQTLGFAGQMLRHADALQWLRHLDIELDFAVRERIEDAPYEDIVPGLVNGLLHLINEACREEISRSTEAS